MKLAIKRGARSITGLQDLIDCIYKALTGLYCYKMNHIGDIIIASELIYGNKNFK